MNRLRLLTLTIPVVLLTQGCSTVDRSFYGPIRPVQAGNIGGVKSCDDPKSGKSLLEDRFVTAACASLKDENSEAKAKAMFEAGFTLVGARCNDFFAQKAGTQTSVRTTAELVAPVVALLTGILSVTDMGSGKRKDWETVLSFGSTAALAGIKVYESNFLFSSDNVENVRSLTTTALNAHATGVRSVTGLKFDTSLQYLIEHQMYCTPGKIRDLAETAIADQKLKPVNRLTGQDIPTGGGGGGVGVLGGGGGGGGGGAPAPAAGTPIQLKSL